MARTAVTKRLVPSTATYTVPVGKIFIFKAFGLTAACYLYVNAEQAAYIASPSGLAVGPFAANAGDVISVTSPSEGGGTASVCGILYDAV